MKVFVIILSVLFSACCGAQDVSPTNRMLAEQQIMQLHDGTLVVRLKTYAKSVQAYREAGKTKLADKLERNYRIANLFLMKAFIENFDFCKVLFIKADDSKKLLSRQPYIFLNEALDADSAISNPAGIFFVAEFGDLMSNDRTSDKSFVVKHTEATATSSSSSAIFISDSTLTQLKEPMPFYSIVSLMDEALPAIAPGMNGAPVDTNSWQIQNAQGSSHASSKVNPIWKKDIYERGVKQLNKKLIEYYCKVNQKKLGKNVTDDLVQWEHKNPNTHAEEQLKLVIAQITKLQDEQFQTH